MDESGASCRQADMSPMHDLLLAAIAAMMVRRGVVELLTQVRP